MNDSTQTLLALAARRAFTIIGTWLAGKGLLQGSVNVNDFVGAAMVIAEVGYEAWNRYGKVLVNSRLAELKGIHPNQIK